MRVLLMHPERDADRETALPEDRDDLARDLDLEPLWETMAGGDRLLRTIVEQTMLNPLVELPAIRWRLDVLADALRHPAMIQELYDLANQGLKAQRGAWLWSGRTASSLLSRSTQIVAAALPTLRALRQFAERTTSQVRSPGLQNLCSRLCAELGEDYLTEVADQVRGLRFGAGMVFTAGVGPDALSTRLALRRPPQQRHRWRELIPRPPQRLHYTLADRDEAGARALDALRDDATVKVAEAVATSSDHILAFFEQLRWEAGFYLCCLRLQQRLTAGGAPITLPEPHQVTPVVQNATGLADAALVLRSRAAVVPSELAADDASLVLVTGANQGGKSTFLRGLGLAQLMMQAGMFVTANGYRASVVRRLHTHFRREEDASLDSGKLDEELVRMSAIVDRAAAGDLVLFNESFACTDEPEGAEIARQIVDALTRAGIRVVFVTHMFTLADGYADRPRTVFLRPERRADGSRSFRILPGRPLPTSHGEDVYQLVFGGSR
ncbi:MAG: hypothetical protein VB093_01240 [Propionicimonas sp.]|nr:hypothetical protein [Propionicimonas sp.]